MSWGRVMASGKCRVVWLCLRPTVGQNLAQGPGPEGPRSPHFLSGQRTSRWAGREFPETQRIRNVWLTAGSGSSMQSPAEKEAGLRGPRERTGKGSLEERARGAPAAQPPKPGWALTLEELAAMSPAQRHRHLLFGDQLEDAGAAASIFPRESVELGSRMPDPRAWTQSPEPPGVRQDRLLGVLKAAEARGRIRALRLRYIRMRAEEISLLTWQQKSARAAIRLELFLPPQLKPTRIPDPLDRQERSGGSHRAVSEHSECPIRVWSLCIRQTQEDRGTR
ncbi:protein LKAAEAR1 isoform X3 [Panthera onca]